MSAMTSTLKILVVEDNAMNQDIIVRQLRRIGFADIAVACNGAEALAWLTKNECSILLTDCQMPVMDGYELTRRIRQTEAACQARLHIVALSASTMEEDRTRCFEVGMDGHISKPTQINDLRVALHRWLPGDSVPQKNC
ncbi:response regulator [Oxalobacteraceae bacterium R-40]|uniref:Response regulator n=1 Tax=Keguizhuia sedimenti TaxID=3064264 RepID=A0ABU1BKY9_9BURK|nr:response regulator [Oxalobacteraceae bacterium R-40]